jgi:hypothetical protein
MSDGSHSAGGTVLGRRVAELTEGVADRFNSADGTDVADVAGLEPAEFESMTLGNAGDGLAETAVELAALSMTAITALSTASPSPTIARRRSQ